MKIILLLLFSQMTFGVGTKINAAPANSPARIIGNKVKKLENEIKKIENYLKTSKSKKRSETKKRQRLTKTLEHKKASLAKQKIQLNLAQKKQGPSQYQFLNFSPDKMQAGDYFDQKFVTGYIEIPDRTYSLNREQLARLKGLLTEEYKLSGLDKLGWKTDWVDQIKHVSHLEYMIHFLKAYDKLLKSIKKGKYERIYVFVGSSNSGENTDENPLRYRHDKSASWIFKMLWTLLRKDRINVYQATDSTYLANASRGRNLLIFLDDVSYSGTQMFNTLQLSYYLNRESTDIKIFIPIVFDSARQKLTPILNRSNKISLYDERINVTTNTLIPFRTHPGGSILGSSTEIIKSHGIMVYGLGILRPQPLVYFDHKLADDLSIPLSNMFARLVGSKLRGDNDIIPIINHCHYTNWYDAINCPTGLYKLNNPNKIILNNKDFLAYVHQIRSVYWNKEITEAASNALLSWSKRNFATASVQRLAELNSYYKDKENKIKTKLAEIEAAKRKAYEEERAKLKALQDSSTYLREKFENDFPKVPKDKLKDSLNKFFERVEPTGNKEIDEFLKLTTDAKIKKISKIKDEYYDWIRTAEDGFADEPPPFSILYKDLIPHFEVFCPGISKDWNKTCLL